MEDTNTNTGTSKEETDVSTSEVQDQEPMARSRINNRLEKETKQTIIYSVIGAIVILALLLKFGIPLFSKLGLFVADKTNSQPASNSQSTNDTTYIAPPILDATFTATNSATVKIMGKADKNQEVKMFVNNSAQNTVTAKPDGSFSFDTVQLDEGQNTIQVKAKAKDKFSEFSNSISILYSKNGPDLSVDSPSDGSTVKESHQTVSGTTGNEATVTVNDHVAIVNSNGSFSYPLSLQDGDNTIKVVATDAAGNKTEKDLKISLRP